MEGMRSGEHQWKTSTSENVSGLEHSVSEVTCGLIKNIGQVPRKLGHPNKLNTNDLQFVGPRVLLGPDNLGTSKMSKSTSAWCSALLQPEPLLLQPNPLLLQPQLHLQA